jgi:hypothetical protein
VDAAFDIESRKGATGAVICDDKGKSKYQFLPPSSSFVIVITLFSRNSFGLPHLENFVPSLTSFTETYVNSYPV